jgi:hypothetical protein
MAALICLFVYSFSQRNPNLQAILTDLTFQSFVDPTNNGNPALLGGLTPG